MPRPHPRPPLRSRPLLRLRLMLRRSMLAQLALLLGVWKLCDLGVGYSGLPLPGGVVGMAVVLALLGGGWVRPASLRRGASWLLAEMLLFFIPASLAVLDHREFLGPLGVKLVAVIALSTLIVMGGTALTVDLCYRLRGRDAVA